MKPLCPCLIFAAVLLVAPGCGKKEVTSLQRKQATALISEAQFAQTVRDFPRAEKLLVEATTLCPDTGGYWVNLGTTRMRMGQRDSAKAAYKSALKAFQAEAKKSKTNADPALQQVFVLALLGQVEDARALQQKLQSKYENNRDVRVFVEEKRLDEFIANPEFKQLAL